jgi:hypothetical protein
MTTSAKPSDVAGPVLKGSPQYKRDIERAHSEGVVEGREQCRHETLTFLQERYMGLESTATPEARAILEITKVLSNFIQTGKRR